MRIWLATVGEPLPFDGDNVRLLRTGQFAEWLVARGHEVVFFTGTMDHYGRRLRCNRTEIRELTPKYHIVLLAGRLYARPISYTRFRNHADVARSFREFAPSLPTPDVVLASYPTEELCRAILDHCEPLNVPVAIDARDFWPDIFAEMLPGPLRRFAPLVFLPFERRARQTLSRAAALSGMTESARDWALKKARREQKEADFWFPFSYATRSASCSSDARAKHLGLNICFLGTLSTRSNLEMLIEAIRLMPTEAPKVTLTICGTGEADATLRESARDLPNVRFLGWLDADELSAVMQSSDLGALPYNRSDFQMSIPNKCVEYLAGGLPIFSCTEGEVRGLLERRGCGVWTAPNAAAMATELAEIARRPDRIAAMKKNAIRVFNDTFERDIAFGTAFEHLHSLVQMTNSAKPKATSK